MTFLQRLLGAALAVLFLLAVLVLSAIALGIVLALGLAAWAWLAWRSRGLPRHHVIEGDYRDVTNLKRLEERGGERL